LIGADNIENIDKWYEYGLRQMQLTWAYPNQLAGSAMTPEQGLTDFGIKAIKKMNELGIIIDCTHSSQKTFTETLNCSDYPILISHAGCKFVSDIKHKDWEGVSWSFCSDDDLRKLQRNGGLLGIHLLAPFFYRDNSGKSDINIADVVDHIEHAVSIMGINHVALGCDYFPDYGEWKQFQKEQDSLPIRYVVKKEELIILTTSLLSRGFSDMDVKCLFGLNYKRLCSLVWK